MPFIIYRRFSCRCRVGLNYKQLVWHNCLASSKLAKMEVGKLKFLCFEIIKQCHYIGPKKIKKVLLQNTLLYKFYSTCSKSIHDTVGP